VALKQNERTSQDQMFEKKLNRFIFLILCKIIAGKCKSGWKIFQKSVKCTLVNIIEYDNENISQLPNAKRKQFKG
jgi:hypothetical protein